MNPHFSLPWRPAALFLLCAFASSCVTVSRDARSTPLEQAAALQKSAGSPGRDPQRFVVSQLRAAQIAASQPDCSARARAISEASTAAVAGWVVANDQSGGPRRFSHDGVTYDLSLPSGRGTIPVSAFESLKPASKVPHTLVKTWQARPGVGAPVAARWKIPADKAVGKFAPRQGYLMPVTAWLDFSEKARNGGTICLGRMASVEKNGPDGAGPSTIPATKSGNRTNNVQLKFLDPTTVRSVDSDGRSRPLAAGFSAPLVDRTRDIREALLALQGLVHPEVRDAALGMLQPYDSSRIPVVFIHGLMSHPRMWRDVINSLMADPKISARYQFWVYYYPTGWPIAYSAMRLRDELAAVDRAVGRQKDIVLVGHSMGGASRPHDDGIPCQSRN
ncbi:MAG: alpha/beta hydrolase [Terrimicrobiaceae bacterium]|nr:alpha/beta hydrolase [Terrimicrobiaceae bacterium]